MKKALLFLLFITMTVVGHAQRSQTAINRDAPIDTLKIFTMVQEMPSFPGGPDKFIRYVQDSLKYPLEARKNMIQGKVWMEFIVERDGTLTDFRIISSPSNDL